MTFEEFEVSNDLDLTRETKICFDKYNDPNKGEGDKPALLLEAQFYMQEIGRREDSRIARRDFWMEFSVIGLILAEIVLSIYGLRLAIKQDKDEQAMMDKQNAILTNLQNSTSDTAAALKRLAELDRAMGDNTSASSKTLLSLRSTTEEMNRAVHDQLSLFYDPSVALTYDPGQDRVILTNTGRSRLTIMALKLDGVPVDTVKMKLIPAGTHMYLEYSEGYKQMSARVARGTSLSVPVEAHLESENGKHFVLNGSLFFVWDKDKLTVHGQNTSVQPEP
jgi:hypothetical protein